MVNIIEFLNSLFPIKSDVIMTEEVSGADDTLGNDWALSFTADVIHVCIEHHEKIKSNNQPRYWIKYCFRNTVLVNTNVGARVIFLITVTMMRVIRC